MQEDKFQAIQTATRAGNKIEAIKLYRELFGVELAEAKDAVEHLETTLRNGGVTSIPSPGISTANDLSVPPEAMANIRQWVLGGQKIAAIKLYREFHQVGLAEAKAAIDRVEAELRLQSPEAFTTVPSQGVMGCIVWLVLLGALGGGIWLFLH